MEQNEKKIKKHWYKKWWGILIVLIILFFLSLFAAMAFYVVGIVKNNTFDNNLHIDGNEKTDIDLKLIEGENNYWLGSATPKITIVEFADFACHYCRNSFPKIRELGLKYKNDVKIIFRDFPVISDYSEKLALAARCAGDQGLFWVMHDKLFLNQGISEDAEIYELAKQIGTDETRFKSCFESQRHVQTIQKDYADGRSLDITGTPTWFINGQKISGDIPLDIFIQIIEQLLNN